MDEHESNEGPITPFVGLPSLQTMAACSASQALLLHFFSHTPLKYTISKSFYKVSGYYARKQIDSLKLPSSIEKILVTCLNTVNYQTMQWETKFNHLLSKNLETLRITRFHPECYVLNPSGVIDYKRTAVQMVSNAGLSEAQKFAIMCIYCLEEQISTVDPKSPPESIVEGINPAKDFLIYYWICRLNNELNKVPLHDFNSVDAVMTVKAANKVIWHNTAFKYFWHRLSEADQISVAWFLFTAPVEYTRFYRTYQNELFSQMSRSQQISLLHQIPERILCNFIIHDSLFFPRAAYWIWKECKDVMTAEQFTQLMTEIIHEKVHQNEEKMKVVVELWRTAPEHLKNFAELSLRDTIVDCLSLDLGMLHHSHLVSDIKGLSEQHCPSFFQLLCMFCSSAESIDFWRRIMLEKSEIVLVNDIRHMGELISLCFPNDEDLVGLKSSIAHSNYMVVYAERMLNNFAIEELSFKLKYFLTDIKSRQEFQKKLLRKFGAAIGVWIDDFGVSSWNQLNDFISEAYADDAVLALKTKEKIGFLFPSKINNHRRIFEKWDEFVDIAHSIFVDDELVTFKLNFLESVRFKFVNYSGDFFHFDDLCHRTIFSKVIPWCLSNDEEAVLRYKNEHLSIDVIFDAMINRLRNCLKKGKRISETVPSQLNDCLKWHLRCEHRTIKYKLKRIKCFNDLFIFEEKLKNQPTSDSESEFKRKLAKRKFLLNVALYWFFSDDETMIFEFVSKNPKFNCIFNFGGEEEKTA